MTQQYADFAFSPITDLKEGFVPHADLHFVYGDIFRGVLLTPPSRIFKHYLELLKTYFPDFSKLVVIAQHEFEIGTREMPDIFCQIPDNMNVFNPNHYLPVSKYNFVYRCPLWKQKQDGTNICVNFDYTEFDQKYYDNFDMVVTLEPIKPNYKLNLQVTFN